MSSVLARDGTALVRGFRSVPASLERLVPPFFPTNCVESRLGGSELWSGCYMPCLRVWEGEGWCMCASEMFLES